MEVSPRLDCEDGTREKSLNHHETPRVVFFFLMLDVFIVVTILTSTVFFLSIYLVSPSEELRFTC